MYSIVDVTILIILLIVLTVWQIGSYYYRRKKERDKRILEVAAMHDDLYRQVAEGQMIAAPFMSSGASNERNTNDINTAPKTKQ